jgi:uncharacterized peroxidase-related enzyme
MDWWLQRTPDDASVPDEVRAIWTKARSRMGFLPAIQRYYALRPKRFLAWATHYQEVMRGESGLTPAEREMIAVVVSHLNECSFCISSHSGYLRAMSGDATLPDRLREDWRTNAPNERARAMLDLAEKLTRDAHGSGPEDLDRLRAAGLSDDDIFDVVETIATFNFTNRLTSALGMHQSPEFEQMGR